MPTLRRSTLILSIFACSMLAGCGKSDKHRNSGSDAAPVAAQNVELLDDSESRADEGNQAQVAIAPTQDWVGRWNGPEGLFLDIQPSPNGKAGHYALTNRDTLDRQADYPGIADGATIRFVRDGKDLAIRPGNGDETGFKYLAGKRDCLIVVTGQEGYCR